MYKCKDCGRIFDEPKLIEDCVGYYGEAPYTEYWDGCPYCESADIAEYREDEDE